VPLILLLLKNMTFGFHNHHHQCSQLDILKMHFFQKCVSCLLEGHMEEQL